MAHRRNLLIRQIETIQGPISWTDPSVGGFRLDNSPLDDEPDATTTIILGRILPNSEIFNQAAFQIEIKLLPAYPFKEPEIRLITKIHHPNVDKNGRIWLESLSENEVYKPTTPLLDIIKRVVYLIDNPRPDCPVNHEIADEYRSNGAEFSCKALEWVRRYGLPRD